MWEVGVLSLDVGGGSCAATPTRLEVGVSFPDVEGGSPVSRCGRWELCCHSDEMWEVGVLSPDVGGGSCAATSTRLEVGVSFPDVEGVSPVSRCGRWELCCLSDEVWEVGVPQLSYKTTRHKLMFQSARFQERVLNFQLHNFSGPLRSLVAPSDPERTVNTRFIGTRGRSDTAG